MRKADRHEAIRERARRAILNIYHNATPTYPCLDERGADRFQGWFEGLCEFEIEYLRGGGANGGDCQKMLESLRDVGRLKSQRARDYYVRWKIRSIKEGQGRCNHLDSRKHLTNAWWECIVDYGQLYQWGRGGRTLAPQALVRTHGGSSFSMREDYADEESIEECVRLIQVVESFNRYVGDWCRAVPEMWAEQVQFERAERRADARRRKQSRVRERAEREYWAERDVRTVA